MAAEAHTAEAAPEHAPAGDPQAFVRLRRWGGERLVREMCGLFLAQVPERVAAAREGVRTNEPVQTERAMHALKSSCAQLGAVRMQVHCAEIERLAAGGDLTPVPEMIGELEREFARYLDWLPIAIEEMEEAE